MIGYASNTGTLRNLAALRAVGWRVLLTPINNLRPKDLKYAIDNGAWSCHQRGIPFDESAFYQLVRRHGQDADFIVLPDIVAGGMASLELSYSWIPRLRAMLPVRSEPSIFLLPVQDGMRARDIGKIFIEYKNIGIFLGGTTEWKLKEMYAWGMVAHAWGRWYHIGRVNTKKRIKLAAEAGADSIDGTRATRWCKDVPWLDAKLAQPSLLTPAKLAEVNETLKGMARRQDEMSHDANG